MLFDRERPHVFREQKVLPAAAQQLAQEALKAADQRMRRGGGLEVYAVHLSDDLTDRVPASGVASAIAVPSGQSRELVSLRLAG